MMGIDDSEDPDASLESLLSGPSYALVIGIDKYDHFPELEGAVADATAVADVLEGKSPGAAGHSGACFTVIRRTDGSTPATKAGIKSGFSELEKLLDEHNASQRARGASPNARVLIYFAGHGVATTKPEEAAGNTPGYFLPKDADRQQRNFLSMNTVRERIKRLPCHHLLLVLDCCYAGAFQSSTTRAAAMTEPRLYRESVERYLREPARHVITSAASDERALDTLADKLLVETLGGNIVLAEHRAELGKQPGVKRYVHGAKSPFAVALVMGLQGDADFPSGAGTGDANPPSDGVITGNEMHLFIENCFTAWGSGGPRFQKPLLFDWPGEPASKGAFIFRNPRKPFLDLESACELVKENNPYQGFLAYGAKEAAMFFGRKTLADKLLAQVKSEAVVMVVGASGTGKSSLVCAGVLPALDDEGWFVLPAVRPVDALRVLDLPLDALKRTVERLFAQIPGKQVVVVIDQLEELISLRHGEAAIAQFFKGVEAAVAASDGRLHVVYTLRSDFEPHFAKTLFAEHRKGRFRVTPMSREELREVIERPAEACVFRFDSPKLVDDMLNEVVDAPGALPLLSFTLSEMYLRYAGTLATRHDRTLTRDDYKALGGVEGSLAHQAQGVYDKRPDEKSKAAMRNVVLRMVALAGVEPTRRRVLLSELTYADPEETDRAKAALEALDSARLVVCDGDEKNGDRFAEPAHDKIVLGWPLLREWLNEPGMTERMDAHRLLRDKTVDWKRQECTGGWMHEDKRLDRWIEILAPVVNAEEKLLLEGSLARRHEEAEREKRQIAKLEAALQQANVAKNEAVAALRVGNGRLASALAGQPGREMEALLLGIDAMAGNGADPATAPAAVTEGMVRALMQARQLGTLEGHTSTVTAVAFSPDGTRVVTGSHDTTARLWDAKDGKPLLPLEGHTSTVRAVAFSSDGMRVVTASKDHTVRLWDSKDGKPLATFKGHTNGMTAMAFSPDGTRVVTVSNLGQTARLWDAKVGKPLAHLDGHTDWVTAVVFSPDGTRVATASLDKTARLWDAKDGKPLATFKGHTRRVNAVAVSPDGTRVATASWDETARLWDAKDGKPLATLEGHTADVWAVAFSPDGMRVVTASQDATARLWDVNTARRWWERKDRKPLATFQRSNAAAFSPDGTRVVTSSSDDSKTRLWHAKDGTPLATLTGHAGAASKAVAFSPDGTHVVTCDGTLWNAKDGKPLATLQSHTGWVEAVAFSPDGTRVVIASQDKTVRLWDARAGKPLATLQGHTERVSVVAFSSDRTRVVTSDGTARLWDAMDGKPLATLEGHTDSVYAVAFSPDGTRVVTASQDKTARLWDAKDGKPFATHLGYADRMKAVAFSPDGTRMVTASTPLPRRSLARFALDLAVGKLMVAPSRDNTAWLWGAQDGRPLATIQDASVVAFSPDGTRVVVLSDAGQSARLWDAKDGKPLAPLEGHTAKVTAVVFSPNGMRMLTESWDHTSRLWDAQDGKLLATLEGHMTKATVFSSDGMRMLTGGCDSTLRLWDAQDGKLLATLEGHTDSVNAMAFSPDGTRVVTASQDKTARLWDAKDGKPLAPLKGHTATVTAVAFSPPDGMRVVTASEDKTARLWEARTGEILAIFPFSGGESSVAFSPDGRHLAIGSDDGTVGIWAATPEGFLIQACQYLRPFPEYAKVADICSRYVGRTP